MVTRAEIEEHWLAGGALDVPIERLVDSFTRVARIFGRPWLDETLSSGVRGPRITLTIHALGEHLAVLEPARGREKLIRRLQARERAATFELEAIAICGADGSEIEIEPEVLVGAGPRVPDFRIRMPGEEWVYVEVTAPTASETQRAAQHAAAELARRGTFRDGLTIQVRFRDEPGDADIATAVAAMETVRAGTVIDHAAFVMHAIESTGVIASIGDDEAGRPVYNFGSVHVEGDKSSIIHARVPYTDERAQQVIDAEAKQLPKHGPGLICVSTGYGRYWQNLVERSYSPSIRRRISGTLMFERALRIGDVGIRIPTTGRLVTNPHARTPLPDWLQARLEALRASV